MNCLKNSKKKFSLIACALLAAFGACVGAQEIDFSGTVGTSWAMAAPWTDNAGDFTFGRVYFDGKLDAWYNESSALVDASVGYDNTTRNLFFSLNEAWADYSSSNWGIRVGRQKTSWGKADGITVTNIICPEDMSSLFADDTTMGIDSVRLSVTGSAFTVDAWWIPFFRGSKLPLEENNPLRKLIVPQSVDLSAMMPGLVVPVSIGTIASPELNIQNGEYALKASGYFPLCDVSAYFFYGWENIPLLKYTLTYASGTTPPPNGVLISGEYKRVLMFGLDAAVPINSIVLRAEGAFFLNREMQTSAKEILSGGDINEKHNNLSGLLGIDWMPSGWTITAQYHADFVFGDMDKLEREDAFSHGATVSVSKTLLDETLELSFAGLVGFNAFDSALTFTAEYSVSDQISVRAGAYVFLAGPKKDGTYGQYKDLSSFFLNAKFSF